MEEKNNEIDLLELFRAINNRLVRFFSWLRNLVLYAIYFLIKNIYLYIATLVISIGLSYTYINILKNKVCRTTLVAQSNVVSNSEIIPIINNIQKALKSGNHEYIATEFKCSIEDVKKIKDIEALYVIDKNDDKIADFIDFDKQLANKSAADTNFVALETEFAIKLDYSDTSIIKVIKKGLLNYLSRNKYLIERDTLNRNQLKALIDKTNNELNEFDSLQTNYNKFVVNNPYGGQDLKSQLLMVNEKDVKLMYKDILTLFNQKQYFESKYALSTKEIITIKTDFVPSLTPLTGFLKLNFYFLIIVSLIVTVAYELIRNRKKIIADLNNSLANGVKY